MTPYDQELEDPTYSLGTRLGAWALVVTYGVALAAAAAVVFWFAVVQFLALIERVVS